MKMFDFFRRSQPTPSQIQRTVKRLTETGGDAGPRIEAAEKLLEWGTPDALYALLKRFTISSKVITQDIEEKRMVVQMLAEKGAEAVEPILRFLKTHHQVEWPIQALSRILPQDALVLKLLDILENVAQSEFTPPEHRSSLIRAARGHITPEIGVALRRFLSDDDDDVRLAAIEAIAEAGEGMREALLEAFIQADDRPRVRIKIAEAFADQEWPVKGYRPKVEEKLPGGFHLTSKGVIRRR